MTTRFVDQELLDDRWLETQNPFLRNQLNLLFIPPTLKTYILNQDGVVVRYIDSIDENGVLRTSARISYFGQGLEPDVPVFLKGVLVVLNPEMPVVINLGE